MAAPVSTFRAYYATEPNPYDVRGDLHQAYRADAAAGQPAALLGQTASTTYALPLLLSSEAEEKPLLVIAPFAPASLPGVAGATDKYAFAGDVSASGALPTLVRLTSEAFHLSDNVAVLPAGGMAAAGAARAPNESYLGPEAVGVNQALEIRTRRAMPVPHEYAERVVALQQAGTLTWRELWTQTALPILADAGMTADYGSYIDYLRVSSTQRPGAAAADPPRRPATVYNYVGALAPPAVQELALATARHFLPGLRQPVGIGAQLALLGQQGTAIQQHLATTAATAIPTLDRKYPALTQQLYRLSEVNNLNALAPYWAQHAGLKTGAWLSAMEATAREISIRESLPEPFISPALSTDIGNGRFTTSNPQGVVDGLSIFRIRTILSADREALLNRNRVYNAMAIGAGIGQVDAVQMVLANNEVEAPESDAHFRTVLEAYYVFLLAFVGRTRAVQEYHRCVVASHYQHTPTTNTVARSIPTRYR